MPIYEYQCRKCGEIFEKIQKMDENGDSLKCPSCGGSKPQKIFSGFSSSKGTAKPCLLPTIILEYSILKIFGSLDQKYLGNRISLCLRGFS
jgi:putative FmdB family regulatory protein